MNDEERAQEVDRKARITCARLSSDPDMLRDLLDALALWPGQEGKRRATTLTHNHNFNKVKR